MIFFINIYTSTYKLSQLITNATQLFGASITYSYLLLPFNQYKPHKTNLQ